MSVYLVCITTGGGIPILSRKHGDIKSLPFPLLASLNGVALFGESHDINLISTSTRDCRILWRDFHKSVRLIVAVSNDTISEVHIHKLLDLVFQSMVLTVGLNDLVGQRNVERTKRDLRASYFIIDRLISLMSPNDNYTNFGDLVGAADCVVFPESHLIQNYLESYVESVDSTYGCVMVDGRIACATKNWWSLHPDEINLLSLSVLTDNWSTLRDVPIFLPVKSPTVPFRFIVCQLLANVTVCSLCGPVPHLPAIEGMLQKNWKSTHSLLSSLASVVPRGFPSIPIDSNILGLVLVNMEKKRVISSLQPILSDPAAKDPLGSTTRNMPEARKFDILRTFYRNTVGPIFPDHFVPTPHAADPKGDFPSMNVSHAILKHPVGETYQCSEFHKCYALQHRQYQLFLLFTSNVPNHFMRNSAHRTLQLFLTDKTFQIIR